MGFPIDSKVLGLRDIIKERGCEKTLLSFFTSPFCNDCV